jgi:YNFM family putative membrane transporter
MDTDVIGHERGTVAYRRLGAAMWCAGLATFVLVYCVQGILPVLARRFGVDAATASLAMSATTIGLAVSVVPLSAVAEGWGRARVMTWSLAAAAVLELLAPLSPTFAVLVGVRALQGVALAALPALAMSHVTAEVAPRWLGGAIGLLIAGNTLGGLTGRLIAVLASDLGGWRVALAVAGGLSLLCTVAFRLLLPPQLAPSRTRPPGLVRALRAQLRDPGLACLYGIGFALMGAFVTLYNYLTFRLIGPPFDLPAGLVGLVFLAYLAGSWASSAAGRLGDRVGRRRTLWVAALVALVGVWLTVPDRLALVIVGTLAVTVGFFGAHALASGWVGRRAALLPGGVPALAAALYLCAYYLGSSVGGTAGGVVYEHTGWTGLAGYISALLATAIGLAVLLRRVPVLR